MEMITSWIVTSLILYGLSDLTSLISVDSMMSALALALAISLLLVLIRFLSGFLKVMGCFTFGISYLVGLFVGIFALPLALVKAQSFVGGFSVPGYKEAIFASIIINLVSSLILDRKK